MLSNDDLIDKLEAIARQGRELAGAVRRNGDLPAAQLAAGFVEAHRLGERLAKLQRQLRASNGRE